MSNLKGVAIKATSFNYPPVCYKENPEDEEYQGLEVCTYVIKVSFCNY